MDSRENNSENPRRPRQGSAKNTGQRKKRSTAPKQSGKTGRSQPAKKSGSQPSAHQEAVRRKVAQVNSRNQREAAAKAAKQRAMRREMGQAAQSAQSGEAQGTAAPKRRVRRPRRPLQPVVYTEPKPFNRSRFFVQIVSIMAIVMALILSLSIFFKVETITVSGANVYSAWTVREASGIEEGDNLLTFSRARASARIQAELPYVESVRIGIKLPNTVNIEITEASVVYAIQDSGGGWWLMTSGGRITEASSSAAVTGYTQVLGVTLSSPVEGETAVAYEASQQSTDETDTETVVAVVTTTGAQKLAAALEILQALEDNDIVGTVASVDVTSLSSIELWYGQQYQVNLGDTSQLDYKIACMSYTVLELGDYETGTLDISFTTWPDQVSYTPAD